LSKKISVKINLIERKSAMNSRKKTGPEVAIMMGSDSDWNVLQKAVDILEQFGVSYEVRVMSAHRSPEAVAQYARNAQKKGIKVIIAGAGYAAHLAGVISAHTVLPVIGVPISGNTLGGIDALLSMVQMPPGVPVATVSIGGATNAGILAVQILALNKPDLNAKLKQYKIQLATKVSQADKKLNAELLAKPRKTQ
jgi:phosphoribosylaminoimidazole carboxylase PurE protein